MMNLSMLKYRDKDKNFRLEAGAERIFYGLDHIDNDQVIIVEGEVDKLSMYETGIKVLYKCAGRSSFT